MRRVIVVLSLGVFALVGSADAQECVACHKEITPNIVSDWQLSQHAQEEVGCSVCHGDGHTTADDVGQRGAGAASLPDVSYGV